MPARNRTIRARKRAPDHEQVRVEIRSFLEALESYPRRFAEDRGKGRRVSFEEHRRSLVKISFAGNGESATRRGRQGEGAED